MTTGTEPVLRWYNLDGTTARSIALDLPPQPVTAEDKAAFVHAMNERIEVQQNAQMKQFLQAQLDAVLFPEQKAYWSSVSVDDAGFIWLGILETSGQTGQRTGNAYRLLAPSGEYLGDTRAPYPGHAEDGCYLAVVVKEDTGERIPTIWRLVPYPVDVKYP
jgi:hypothetical protein